MTCFLPTQKYRPCGINGNAVKIGDIFQTFMKIFFSRWVFAFNLPSNLELLCGGAQWVVVVVTNENLPYMRFLFFLQDKDKPVPALTSHNYGRPCRPFYDFSDRTFNRQDQISDFYRRKGGVVRIEEREPL